MRMSCKTFANLYKAFPDRMFYYQIEVLNGKICSGYHKARRLLVRNLSWGLSVWRFACSPCVCVGSPASAHHPNTCRLIGDLPVWMCKRDCEWLSCGALMNVHSAAVSLVIDHTCEIYYRYSSWPLWKGLTFVFNSFLCLHGLSLSVVCGLCSLLKDPSISRWEWTEWGWKIKESCVLTVVFHDVGLCLSFLSQLLHRYLFYTVIPRHKVRGVNEKLSGQCSRPKIRFLRGWEQPFKAMSSFTYEMFVWKQFRFCITHRKVSADLSGVLLIHHSTKVTPLILFFK